MRMQKILTFFQQKTTVYICNISFLSKVVGFEKLTKINKVVFYIRLVKNLNVNINR